SNYPFGEVGSATWTSTNGSKVGNCVFPGYSGTVFEPIDEYKGDFARSYFYMLTRYLDVAPTWSS
ncbi:MAG: endonuclease, partial [Oscillatoria sp. Prado101]|nr:endonuclease [Oscillatoria sp. Prado101]